MVSGQQGPFAEPLGDSYTTRVLIEKFCKQRSVYHKSEAMLARIPDSEWFDQPDALTASAILEYSRS